jgi:FKBP-type peptidyl-prolyl cis-trans isomerase (trigger factor)
MRKGKQQEGIQYVACVSQEAGGQPCRAYVEVKGKSSSPSGKRIPSNAKKIARPGFRMGKAPRAKFERAYARSFYEGREETPCTEDYSEAVAKRRRPVDAAGKVEILKSTTTVCFKAVVQRSQRSPGRI